MKEININLNVHEIGIILTSIQNLDIIDEIRISREYGSVTALQDRLYQIWKKMDKSETGLRNDVTPSF